jgi:predicted cupin superfamily sugar epimerase
MGEDVQIIDVSTAFAGEAETVQAVSTTVTSTFMFESFGVFRDKDLFEVDHVPDSILQRKRRLRRSENY